MEPLRQDYIDSLYEQNFQHSDHHMLCLHCEEYISNSAQACPYCRKPVIIPTATVSAPYEESHTQRINTHKITSLEKTNLRTGDSSTSPRKKKLDSQTEFMGYTQEGEFSDENTNSSAPLIYILSLLALILGNAFFFLGALFPIVAHEGKITLTWNESLWIPFLIFGGVCIYLGYHFLQKIEVSFEEKET